MDSLAVCCVGKVVRALYVLIGAAGVWGAYAMGMKMSKK
jgi:uncharacterized membrane protein YuzA (DUF378 family)